MWTKVCVFFVVFDRSMYFSLTLYKWRFWRFVKHTWIDFCYLSVVGARISLYSTYPLSLSLSSCSFLPPIKLHLLLSLSLSLSSFPSNITSQLSMANVSGEIWVTECPNIKWAGCISSLSLSLSLSLFYFYHYFQLFDSKRAKLIYN